MAVEIADAYVESGTARDIKVSSNTLSTLFEGGYSIAFKALAPLSQNGTSKLEYCPTCYGYCA
ncbi:hypothetical protein BGZ59_003652, partial [Podila verticillata]